MTGMRGVITPCAPPGERVISLARGVPSEDMLPARQLADAARAALEGDPVGALSYGDAEGNPRLRTWFGRQLGVDPTRVLLTNGSLQGLGLLAEHLAQTGRRLIVEAPTYDFALRVLRRGGLDPHAVPIAEDGIDLGALAELLRRRGPSVLYTIPTFHNPTGTTLSASKRAELLGLAGEHELLIIEDDPYRLLALDGDPPPTLLSADRGEHVIHLTSLTKTIAPGLRCGAMVLPTPMMEPMVDAARSTYIAPGQFAQATAMAYIESGAFEPVLELARALLRERRDAALNCLAVAGGISWSIPAGGYFLWVELTDASARELAERAARIGVRVVPGNEFFVDGESDRHLRVAFCAAPVDEVREAMTRLVQLLGSHGRDRSAAARWKLGQGDSYARFDEHRGPLGLSLPTGRSCSAPPSRT